MPKTVFAAGGVGSGGTGSSGASGGHATRNGWGWMVYQINGPGPTDGFSNGSWPNIQATCGSSGAGQAVIYGLANSNGSGTIKGFAFTQTGNFRGGYQIGDSVDGGRATVISVSDAASRFNELPSHGVDIGNYNFWYGSDKKGTPVGWFCYSFGGNPGGGGAFSNPVGNSSMTCDGGFKGWMVDADDYGAKLNYTIAIKNAGADGSTYKIIKVGSANEPVPDPPYGQEAHDLGQFTITNVGFSFNLPDEYRDGKSYDWVVLAVGVRPNQNEAPFVIIGPAPGSFNCPSNSGPWDVGVGVMCDVDNNRAVFTFTKSGTISGNVSITRKITLSNPDDGVMLETTSYNNSNWPSAQQSVDVGSMSLGQSMYAEISVTPGGGGAWSVVSNDSANCPTSPTPRRVAKPYLRVYGNDVVVGRQFVGNDGTCSSKMDSTITAFSKQNIAGEYVGAGSQFAVSSAGQIVSFLSADMHDDGTAYAGGEVTKPYNSLMFNNTGNTPSTYMGNDSNGYTGCLPDYSKFVTDNDSTFYKSSGGLAIDDITDISNNSAYNRIYVDGDLTIGDNIKDPSSLSSFKYSSLSDFKPVIVIVNGNINIKGNVTQLDGLYVALPKKDGSGNIVGGTINTCSDPGDTPTVIDCGNKLTINGSFVANKVLFNRLKGDIASASPNEASNNGNIAESFVFTSDLYFGLMSKQDPSDNNEKTTGTQYESIVGLPPVL